MPDVREQIRNSRPDPESVPPLDVEQIVHRARRQRTVTRAAGLVGAFALVAGGVVAVQAVRPSGTVYVDDGANPGTGTPAVGGPGSDPAASPRTADATVNDPGTLGGAIDDLIAANRRSSPRPVADEPDELLIERTYAIWNATTVDVGGGDATHALEVVWYETRTDADGHTEIVREKLEALEPSDDLAQLRREAQPHLNAGPSEPREPLSGGDPRDHAAQALDEAERDSHGSAEPAPGRTERPDQAHAFVRAADALRVGLQPNDRIRALQTIDRLDPELVEYRGSVKDLLGREGIGIAGRDGDGWHATNWNVLIFDPETGDLLGEYTEFAGTARVDAPPITSYTAREAELVDPTTDSSSAKS